MVLSFIAFLHDIHIAPRPRGNCRPRVPLRALVVGALALTSARCTSHACTEVGCMNQLGVTFNTATGAWTDGVYELAVRADDQLIGTCTLRVPEELPDPPGSGVSKQCGSGLRFDVASQTECEMGCDAGICWQKCTPIPGKFESRLAVTDTPSHVELTILRDGQTILDEKVEPTYHDAFPNGPECGGACRQATLAYTVP